MRTIAPKSAIAFEVKKGQTIRVTDVEGSQVADFVCFKQNDYSEYFSQANTRANNQTIRITTGHALYSNHSNVMFRIIEDTVGVHDLLFAPCNWFIYDKVLKVGPRNGCLENLAIALKPYSIQQSQVPDPFNIFMHTHIDENYVLSIKKPVSKAGDYIVLAAEMDCLVAITSCAEDVSDCNEQHCTPIQVEITS